MNKNLKEFSPSLLVPSEMLACAERFSDIVTRNVQNDASVTNMLNQLKTSAAGLETAMQSKKVNVLTADMAAKDEARNAAFRSLYSALMGSVGVEVMPDVKNAAGFLVAIIKRQGTRVDRQSYTKKTGALKAILDAFQQPDAQTYIGQLNVAGLVQQLSAAHQAFEGSFQSKVTTDAKQNSVGLRVESNEVSYYITKLFHYIDFQAQTGTGHASVVPELNEAISDIMSKAHGRKTRSQDANVAPVPVPTPAPVAVSPSSKVVPMPQQPEAQAKAA